MSVVVLSRRSSVKAGAIKSESGSVHGQQSWVLCMVGSVGFCAWSAESGSVNGQQSRVLCMVSSVIKELIIVGTSQGLTGQV